MKRRGGSAPPCLARLALCAALATAQAQAQSQTLRERLGAACWQQQELGVGVSLRRAWFASLAVREQGPLPTGPQSLTILEVDLEAPDTRLTVAVPDLLRATSAQARDGGALAAVNGGFFTKDGKPVGMRLADGVAFGVASSPPRAAVGWNGRQVRFGRGSEDWSDWPQLVAAGPHLVAGGVVIDHGDKQRKVRHPRTALGVRGDGVVLLLTADGRTPLAAGLSLDELGDVMLGLGCVDAINLDGGGRRRCGRSAGPATASPTTRATTSSSIRKANARSPMSCWCTRGRWSWSTTTRPWWVMAGCGANGTAAATSATRSRGRRPASRSRRGSACPWCAPATTSCSDARWWRPGSVPPRRGGRTGPCSPATGMPPGSRWGNGTSPRARPRSWSPPLPVGRSSSTPCGWSNSSLGTRRRGLRRTRPA
ncbi:MAG: phosphodiester glycosidase family protein [Planctomycetes bacterium]|nr:phosphodiester glycosidase family protein [Planctomycetota bacterium]MCB9886963.1 phosphodiester glycosidase family protein [Planctomycetota bacterium]